MESMNEIVNEFLIESYESLDRLDQDLMALEEVPDDRNRLSSVFRVIHTIKGTSGFLAFNKLEHLTHVGESLLVLLRDGKIRLNSEIATALLAMVDAVRKIMTSIEAGEGEGSADHSALISTLENLQSTGGVQTVAHGSDSPRIQQPEQIRGVIEIPVAMTREVMTAVSAKEEVTINVNKKKRSTSVPSRKKAKAAAGRDSELEQSKPFVVISEDLAPASSTARPPAEDVVVRPSLGEAMPLAAKKMRGDGYETASTEACESDSESSEKGQSHSISDSTIRIDVNLLDRLMNLVGELVLTRNQIMQYSRSTEDASLIAASQRLNLITSELQEGVMRTRMQPIQNVWAKLPRVVRDLSVTCKKKVQVKMEGAETELDKTILEAIRDPLTHIVRNSIDHGIESTEIRRAKGKPVEGTLTLRAFHEGGQVNIEISDDGGGIDLARVKEKAINQGLITAEQANSMSERELINLILLPGFSTAASVTNVSGRGVGMDVVKTNVEKIGGTLDIYSVYGQGTTLKIKIPLTLAIVPALMVTCEKDRYAIPQNSLVELVRLENDRARREIEQINGVPIYRLRGNLLPLLYLDEQLQLRPTRTAAELSAATAVNIIVLSAENRQFGLVVDQISDTEEIVVKPLGPHLKDIGSYAGVTIMGDGAVAMILDVVGIARKAHVISATRERGKTQSPPKDAEAAMTKQTLLLLGVGNNQRMAIPLSAVSRLEEISIDSIEWSNGRQVVQYGGQIMPLIHLGEAIHSDGGTSSETNALQVVVYTENGRSIGLIVDRILDIVETTSAIPQRRNNSCVVGSTVIQNRVTDLLDIQNVILANDQDFFLPQPTTLAV